MCTFCFVLLLFLFVCVCVSENYDNLLYFVFNFFKSQMYVQDSMHDPLEQPNLQA